MQRKMCIYKCMLNVYKNQQNRQTGSRNLMGPKMLPTIWGTTHWTYMLIFRRIFLSNYWWQKSDIWSQASYRYPISWEAFLDPSDSYFLFADFVDFYTHWTYICICTFFKNVTKNVHICSMCIKTNKVAKQEAGIWRVQNRFCHIVGSDFGPVRFLLPVWRLSWFLYTLNIYAHFSLHFSQQLLMAEIWYLDVQCV
jgi:hypothetical protein